MSSQIPSTPGLQFPTQKGMLSGNPRDSAIATQNQTNIKQTNLGNAVGGKRMNKRIMDKRKGGANSVVIPQFNMQYKTTGGPGQDPNSIIQQNSQTSTQATANAVYDNYATQKGGLTNKKSSRKGGTNKYSWGCYSGGKRLSKKHASKKHTSKKHASKKSRKIRK